MVSMAHKRSTQVSFRQPIAPATGAIITNASPFNGRITSLLFHFPLGCNSLVLVAFRALKGRYPVTGHVALDNANPVYPVDIPTFRFEVLEVEVLNTDLGFAHTPSVVATVEEE